MRGAAKAANPFAAGRNSLCRPNFNALIPECAALAEPGYEDGQKLTLIVEEFLTSTVTLGYPADGHAIRSPCGSKPGRHRLGDRERRISFASLK